MFNLDHHYKTSKTRTRQELVEHANTELQARRLAILFRQLDDFLDKTAYFGAKLPRRLKREELKESRAILQCDT